jgi:hypothetical protein
MRSSIPASLSRHLVAAGVLAAAVSSAACRDDVTAPQTPVVAKSVDQPSANFVVPIAVVTLHVINVWGQPVPEAATVKFTTSKGSVQVVDNAAGDLDPTMGTVKVAMTQAASYEACITDGTANYNAVPWDPTYPICRSLTSSSTKVDLGSAYMRRIPKVGFYFQDMQGNAAKGGTLTTVWPGNYTLSVYDGMPGWDAVVDGLITLKLVSGPGTYSWCETKAPPGFMLTSPTCGSFVAAYDVDIAILLKHQPLLKLPG